MVTLRLVIFAMVLALVLAIISGVLSATRQYSWLDYAFRLGGGKFAVLRPGSEAVDARELFEAFRVELAGHPIGDVGVVSVSGGVAELIVRDDAGSLVARAEAALSHAKRETRGSVMLAGGDEQPRAQELLHAVPTPGDVVAEG